LPLATLIRGYKLVIRAYASLG